jgi:hypothetical protein
MSKAESLTQPVSAAKRRDGGQEGKSSQRPHFSRLKGDERESQTGTHNQKMAVLFLLGMAGFVAT